MTSTITLTTSPARARAIMRSDFFGIEEVIQHFGTKPVGLGQIKLNLATLAAVPFSDELLEFHQKTHLLVLRLPLSLDEIGTMFPNLFWTGAAGTGGIKHVSEYGFAKNCGPVGWHLIKREPFDVSWHSVDEARGMLARYEQVPPARVMVYAIITHYLATGERLFSGPDDFVRTSNIINDFGSDGSHHVYMGNFDEKGMYVGGYGSTGHADGFGFASEVKPMI